MKDLIKQLFRENLQQADKYYFNSGKLSPKVREIIMRITNGDPYTKLVTDIYYWLLSDSHRMGDWALSMIDKKHVPSDEITNDMDYQLLKQTKEIYEELKNYNKNVFPISGFNINGVDNVGYFINALKQRKLILNLMKDWPSVALRNLKQDIKQERTYPELQEYRSDLEYFDALYSQLNNRNDSARKNIEKKMFTSGNNTLEDLLQFAQEKENLLGGTELNKKTIIDIVKEDQETSQELRIRYNKNNIMIIEVSGPDGIKKIGCNSVWCFTYNRNGYTNFNDWYNNSTNEIAYIIIDFSLESNDPQFMYVLTKPLMYDYSVVGSDGDDRLYDMGNYPQEEPNTVISSLMDFEQAMRIMNFGIKQPKEKKKKQKFVDPNQLSLDLHEARNIIKKMLRENLGDNQTIKLYHRIGNKKGYPVSDLIKSVLTNGLKLHDNGEIGPVIWFSDKFDDYAKNGSFVVAYDYNIGKTFEENNGIHYDKHNAFGYQPIPIDKLTIIKIPIMSIHGNYFTNEDIIRQINISKMTPESFNKISGDVTIFSDLFQKFVQPYINYPDFLNGLDNSKINLTNIW